MKKAEATRSMILQKSFELIYHKGYRATSIDEIIATTEVTKGAFYYHFKNKEEMGLAIINEILKPTLSNSFVEPLMSDEDPVETIYNLMDHLLLRNEFLRLEFGCPASNLSQEMAPWHTEFSKALDELTRQWIDVLAGTIERGKKRGTIRQDVNATEAAMFVISGYWGIRNLGKLRNDNELYTTHLKALKTYLNSLR